jgi:uncharacterized FAD-dependent dehydrogenase
MTLGEGSGDFPMAMSWRHASDREFQVEDFNEGQKAEKLEKLTLSARRLRLAEIMGLSKREVQQTELKRTLKLEKERKKEEKEERKQKKEEEKRKKVKAKALKRGPPTPTPAPASAPLSAGTTTGTLTDTTTGRAPRRRSSLTRMFAGTGTGTGISKQKSLSLFSYS